MGGGRVVGKGPSVRHTVLSRESVTLTRSRFEAKQILDGRGAAKVLDSGLHSFHVLRSPSLVVVH